MLNVNKRCAAQKGINMKNIYFIISDEQAKDICEHYGKNREDLEDYEVEELLDRLIDDALFSF